MRTLRSAPLPLLLVAAMLVIAVAIEAVGYHTVDWLPKLPLAALLLAALAGSIRSRDPRAERSRP